MRKAIADSEVAVVMDCNRVERGILRKAIVDSEVVIVVLVVIVVFVFVVVVVEEGGVTNAFFNEFCTIY